MNQRRRHTTQFERENTVPATHITRQRPIRYRLTRRSTQSYGTGLA
jgi:hypothetical protein